MVIVVGALGGGIGPGVAEAQSRVEFVRLPVPRYDGTLTPYTFEPLSLAIRWSRWFTTRCCGVTQRGSRGPGWRVR
jgi:hypothetical protein